MAKGKKRSTTSTERALDLSSVSPGTRASFAVPVSESYSSETVMLPVEVLRGNESGPTVFITGAVHGDEVNGAGVIRGLLRDDSFALECGTLILVPVVNILGFERHSRYLPDRRDLNRSFPGDPRGSQARRYAHRVFTEIAKQCDAGIDLHTGAVRRANYPNLRADLADPGVANLARAFGCQLLVDTRGPEGTLRRAASAAGCPTIVLEGGEVWRITSDYEAVASVGIRNVLAHLGMLSQAVVAPDYAVDVRKTKWIRADEGGLLEFHVALGSLVEKGDRLASCRDLLARPQQTIRTPTEGVVMGMSTSPMVQPGDPVCHIARPEGGIAEIKRQLGRAP